MNGTADRVRRDTVILVVVMLTALALRVWRLAGESPWWDEIASLQYLDARNLVEFLRLERSGDPVMPPVYFTLEYFWSRVFGPGVTGMRMLSVILGTVSIPLVYLIGKRLFGSGAGLTASTFMAVSLTEIYFSQEIRVYALVTLLALASMYGYIRALETDALPRWWLLNVASNLLLAFTHLFGVLLFVPQGLLLMVQARRRLRIAGAWIIAHLVILGMLALWLRSADAADIGAVTSWIVAPGPRELAMFALIFSGGRATNENPSVHLPTGISLDIPIAAVLCLLVAAGIVRHWRTRPMSLAVAVSWLLIPPAVLLFLSAAIRPCFVYRYVLYAAPALYLLAGAGIAPASADPLRRRVSRRLGLPIAVFVLILLMFAHQLTGRATGPFRPDWRAVSRYLESHAGPDDRIVVFQEINDVALRFNSSLPDERIVPAAVWSAVTGPVVDAHRSGRTAWVVLWLWTKPDNIEADLAAHGLKYTGEDFGGWPGLRVYRIAGGSAALGAPTGGAQ